MGQPMCPFIVDRRMSLAHIVLPVLYQPRMGSYALCVNFQLWGPMLLDCSVLLPRFVDWTFGSGAVNDNFCFRSSFNTRLKSYWSIHIFSVESRNSRELLFLSEFLCFSLYIFFHGLLSNTFYPFAKYKRKGEKKHMNILCKWSFHLLCWIHFLVWVFNRYILKL